MKETNPSYSICDIAKELGRRWAEMDPSLKQRYQARAEEERQKYDVDMAAYRQGNLSNLHSGGEIRPTAASTPNHSSPSPSPSYTQTVATVAAASGAGSSIPGTAGIQRTQTLTTTADYSTLLQ